MSRDMWLRAGLIGLVAGTVLVIAPARVAGQEKEKGERAAGEEGRGKELLEGYKRGFAKKVQSVDQTLSLVSYDERGQVASKWKGHVVVDFRGRRAMVEGIGSKREKDEERADERVVILPEKAYLIKRNDVDELTPAQRAGFDLMFREAASDFLPIASEGEEYSRHVKYGDIVEGEQVKGRPLMKTAEPLVSLRLVFDREGRVLAAVREFAAAAPGDGGDHGAGLRPRHEPTPGKGPQIARPAHPRLQVTRFKEPVAPGDVKKFGNKSIYALDQEGGRARLVAESRVEKIAINEPLDEANFAVDLTKIDKEKPKVQQKPH